MPPIAVLVALADPTRCRIIEILSGGPQPVHQLADAFDISRPAISRHLRVLKQAKLISEKKAGRENRYALHANRLNPVREWLDGIALPPAAPAKTATASKTPQATRSAKTAPTQVAAPVAVAPAAKPSSQMGFDF